MPVHQLQRQLPNAEYQAWAVYYARKQQQRELANRR